MKLVFMIRHLPVLAEEIYLNLPSRLWYYFDWTLWHWWHVQYILDKFLNIGNTDIKVVWVDKDNDMLTKTKKLLSNYNNIVYFNESYYKIDSILSEARISNVDFILLDLWVNLEHFKDSERWFSIKFDAELDMRFDRKQSFSAKDLIANYTLDQLKWLFIKYWDFPVTYAHIIAEGILKARQKKTILTTFQLKDLLRTLHLNEKKIAVIFQCIRIEVNSELQQLEEFLQKFPSFLSKWWRCSIITYHSIEDRIVKIAFKELSDTWKFRLVNKHVIKPTFREVQSNKAARSAKLRIIEAL